MANLWHRWKFHLSALILLVPLGLTPNFFAEDRYQGMAVRTLTLGAFEVEVSSAIEPPTVGTDGRPMKTFTLAFRPEDTDDIRAAFLRVGKPRILRAAGALAQGSPYRARAQVPMPDRRRDSGELWVTIERWDGGVDQAFVPLAPFLPEQG